MSLSIMQAALLMACTDQRPHAPVSSDTPLPQRLAAADPTNGARLFRQCAACHSLGVGTGDRDGPNLWAVLGAAVATNSPRFAYTAALKRAGGRWTCERMDAWLADPGRFAPGSAMAFPGLSDGADRADVIALLAQSGGTITDASCRALAVGPDARTGM
ncbi:c-type cytochrome [Sphingomonas sp.]|uniref:c-type cytochrome n=1 Tax=Sphingomonas sp. TaxID=28214 RepID=UPI0025F2DF46|nr:c-type cytochrome [Sphingomonas sp.]